MQAEQYVKRCLLIILIPLFCMMGINFVVDPYSIFNTNIFKISVEPSQYFNKIEFLEKNHQNFNSYLMGSSAIGFTNPEIIEKYMPGSRFYNLWISSATQYENLFHLKYLLKKKFPLKNIYLQIDPNLNLTSFRHQPSDYARKLHPAVAGTNKILYYFDYLTVFPNHRLWEKLLVNWHLRKSPTTFTDFSTGMVYATAADKAIAEDPIQYIHSITNFTKKNSRMENAKNAAWENIKAIKEMKTLCDQHQIHLIVFIHPEHQVDEDVLPINDYLTFLRALAEITNYWNFSGYNTITTDDKYYYEPGHYRPIVSKLIAARIFGDPSVAIPEDFGFLVKKTNMERYLLSLQDQFLHREKTASKNVSRSKTYF